MNIMANQTSMHTLCPLANMKCMSPLTLLAKMEEHADGDARRKQPKVELPAPTLVVSYSPPALPPLKVRGLGSCWPTTIPLVYSSRYLLTLSRK